MADTPPPLPLLQRVWLILTQATLLLPFVTARDCGSGHLTDYTGFELYSHEGGALVFVPLLVVTALLLVFPYRGAPVARALAPLGVRTFAVAVAFLVALAGPSFALLFDQLTYHAGWYLHVGGWATLTAAFLTGALSVLAKGGGARPHGRLAVAVVALPLAPPIAVLGNLLHNELRPIEALLGLSTGLVVVIPLALAGLGLAREQLDQAPATPLRGLWWVLVALTLAAHLSAALAD